MYMLLHHHLSEICIRIRTKLGGPKSKSSSYRIYSSEVTLSKGQLKINTASARCVSSEHPSMASLRYGYTTPANRHSCSVPVVPS
ncbi:unnamed protein product [Protopolystoma xenopodis]|uniref:Uncharacterized protein n=1 Tax=Protopolystoma xenopodis TaxID=117903 RepID=A0A448WN07_9PLAT|nr:unnamed protein product [Protopolystoma xenopodis]